MNQDLLAISSRERRLSKEDLIFAKEELSSDVPWKRMAACCALINHSSTCIDSNLVSVLRELFMNGEPRVPIISNLLDAFRHVPTNVFQSNPILTELLYSSALKQSDSGVRGNAAITIRRLAKEKHLGAESVRQILMNDKDDSVRSNSLL